ncbi:FAD-dependent oxidoreductase [Legionella fallonii]|uniref:Protoporphyrinogen oxidase n=1 Tax=Legionella fallonii LLAP-10 TaxID=1212491 RepID=A0A098GBQ1_9GAMM|nr:FAD-dependent oxidoreductase [Legionella fallonii]CEG58911.1 Protoporphyrinogen oxidase [Legionella fallonii LLAP-10]
MKNLPNTVIFVGAGPSALFAALRLEQLAQEQQKEIKFIFLEKEPVVGGKCHTFSDPQHPNLKTEWGAGIVAANYGVVLDALNKYDIGFEDMIPTVPETVEIRKKYDNLSPSEKITFMGQVTQEITVFNGDYGVYKRAKQNKTELPESLLVPFMEYAKLRNMQHIPLLLKSFVPGFGYGDLSHCPTYSVLEYMGKMTIPEILVSDTILRQPGLLAIHGGFQLVMEKIAAHWDVRLSAKITEIKRESDKVTVQYQQNGIAYSETADVLVLANSPKNWPTLNLDMSETERQCVEQLESYRYPVAVYRIKGLPARQYFFPNALEENGFGQLALITSRDNRPDPEEGRLCTVYINLPPNTKEFTFDHEAIKRELMTIEGVTDCSVVEEKIWEDYMSTLPWHLRLELDKEQQNGNTLYLGSYVLGGFEDVACVANKATDTINELFFSNKTYEEDFSWVNVGRAWRFFTQPVYPPLDSLDEAPKPKDRCIII